MNLNFFYIFLDYKMNVMIYFQICVSFMILRENGNKRVKGEWKS